MLSVISFRVQKIWVVLILNIKVSHLKLNEIKQNWLYNGTCYMVTGSRTLNLCASFRCRFTMSLTALSLSVPFLIHLHFFLKISPRTLAYYTPAIFSSHSSSITLLLCCYDDGLSIISRRCEASLLQLSVSGRSVKYHCFTFAD